MFKKIIDLCCSIMIEIFIKDKNKDKNKTQI